jgi:ectoine hydroxylase-related dioxygenase (phytanoyl-CoA dioxygenase family)
MNEHGFTSITDTDVESFQTDGAVCLRNMIGTDWIEKLSAGVDDVIASPTELHTVQTVDGESGYFLSDICMAQSTAALQDFVLNSPAAAVAARLMRSSQCNFWADTLWVKDGGTPKRTRWHQDQPFFWVDGKQMCVIWWPLDSVRLEDSLELVKGSHRWGKWYAPELSKKGQDLYQSTKSDFERMPDITANPQEYPLLSWALEPGDCIVFHGSMVHGAPGNSASRRRRAVSTIWMGDDARLGERPSPGRPHFHGHDLELGDRMNGGYFPKAWPRDGDDALEPTDFARFTDPALRITN